MQYEELDDIAYGRLFALLTTEEWHELRSEWLVSIFNLENQCFYAWPNKNRELMYGIQRYEGRRSNK